MIDKITDADPDLCWHSAGVHEKARTEFVERSYGVPWALRYLAHKLLAALDRERRTTIEVGDVSSVETLIEEKLESFSKCLNSLKESQRAAHDQS